MADPRLMVNGQYHPSLGLYSGEVMVADKQRPFTLAILIPLFLSLAAWLSSFVFTTFDDKRKGRLVSVRAQIVDLYGPMYTLSAAHDAVWSQLGSTYKPDFSGSADIPPEQITNWRTVLQKVIQPLSAQMEETFLSSKQLIRCSSIRDELHQFIAYAEAVKVVTSGWTDSNLKDTSNARNVPVIAYPHRLSELLSNELDHLHDRETMLSYDFKGLFIGEDTEACPN